MIFTILSTTTTYNITEKDHPISPSYCLNIVAYACPNSDVRILRLFLVTSLMSIRLLLYISMQEDRRK